MSGFGQQLRMRVRSFFTNWHEYEASVGRKVVLTIRNRAKSVYTLSGCCGNDGESGC
ncbi:MAG: hypothetical protein WD004_01120 [Actinomycetota bacterium]